MSTRRGNDEAPVSLFSFQDIITSVSGVLIFLVLMFALQLAKRSATAARTPPARTTPTVPRPSFCPDRTREIQGRLAYLDNLKLKAVADDRLRGEHAADLTKLDRLRKEMADLSATNRVLLSNVVAMAHSYSNAVRELEDRDIYGQIDSGTKEPTVVLCSASEILCGKLMTSPQRFAGAAKESAFLTYVSRSAADARRTYYLFLLMPSSAIYAWPLVRTVQSSGSSVGWQPWLEEKTFHFQKGAP